MSMLFLVRHAPVTLDLARPASEWGLSAEGHRLAQQLAALPVFRGLGVVYTSPEVKARATAESLALHWQVPLIEHAALVELDRGPKTIAGQAAYELAVRSAFAAPHSNVNGWESAAAAQHRIIDAVKDIAAQQSKPCAVVSHGLVLSLLITELMDRAEVDVDTWQSLPLPALALVDTSIWHIVTPFKSIVEWQAINE